MKAQELVDALPGSGAPVDTSWDAAQDRSGRFSFHGDRPGETQKRMATQPPAGSPATLAGSSAGVGQADDPLPGVNCISPCPMGLSGGILGFGIPCPRIPPKSTFWSDNEQMQRRVVQLNSYNAKRRMQGIWPMTRTAHACGRSKWRLLRRFEKLLRMRAARRVRRYARPPPA